MSTEPTPTDARATGSGTSPIHRLLLEAMTNEDGGAKALTRLLEGAQLNAEQQAMLELLVSLEEKRRDSDAGLSCPRSEEPRLASLEQELADLREVNDTCAAALGACRVCWGGDTGCPVCGGRGQAGFAMPDLVLFRELVSPAIRRVRELRRTNAWRTASDTGRGSSQR
jgi:hypothetical protein